MIWQKAMILVAKVYSKTNTFPKEEMYGLTSQVKRSSFAIPCNIAKGYGRKGKKDYLKFLNISMSSLFELQTQIEITVNLNFLSKNDFEEISDNTREIERMLSRLSKKWKDDAFLL